MTLANECAEDSFNAAKLRNPFPHDRQFLCAQLLRLSTVPAVLERQQIGDLFETKAERLGCSDETMWTT